MRFYYSHNHTSYVQSWCRTFRGSVTSYKIISTDLCTHRNLELVTINSSSPRQNIIVIPGRVKSKHSNVRKNILLLWVPLIVVTTLHSTTFGSPLGIFPILFKLLSLEIGQKPAHTHVNTTEKVLLGHFLQIYS